MRLSLKPVATNLRRFKSLLFGKSAQQVDACPSAGALKKSDDSSKQEEPMVKVGEKVLVIARVTQIIEDEDGIHYVVAPDDKKRTFFTLRIRKEDIQSCLEN